MIVVAARPGATLARGGDSDSDSDSERGGLDEKTVAIDAAESSMVSVALSPSAARSAAARARVGA